MTRIGMLLLTLAAFAWRMDRLAHQSLWRDEVDAVWFATRYLPETLAMFVQPGQNGPLYFVVLRPWFWLAGSSELALRLPSAFAGALCVPLLWQLARRMIPPGSRLSEQTAVSQPGLQIGPAWAPALAALFFAFNPYQLWYGQEGKMYALITLLALLATWFWWEGVAQGGWRPWFAYWLTVTVAMYSHLLFILIFPLHFLWFFIAWPQSKHHWRGYGGALAALTLPYLPMVLWQWELLFTSQQVTGFRFTPLPQMLRTLVMNHAQGFMPPLSLLWLGPIFFLAVVGIVLGWGEIGVWRARDGRPQDAPTEPVGDVSQEEVAPLGGKVVLAPWRRYLLLLTWVVVPVVGIYALSLRQPLFTDRYVIWIAPALMMFMALGAVVVRTHVLWLARTLAVLFVVYVLALWLYGGWQQKSLPMKYDLRGGVTYVDARRMPDELLILQIPHLEWAYRYYTSDQGARPFDGSDARLGRWAEGLWTNHGWADADAWADVQARMAQMTADADTVWLLRSEPEMWDSRRLMDRWLDEHGELIDEADFVGAQARRYRLHPSISSP